MGILAAYMVPHPPMILHEVGRGREEQIRQTIEAYETAAREIAELAPDTIVITSPHSVMYSDYFHISPGREAAGDFGGFGAREVSFQESYDQELCERVAELAVEHEFPAGTEGERDRKLDHGTMVPLYFIRKYYTGGRIVRIGLSGLSMVDHYQLGQYISQAAEELGRRAVFVASGDLSHKLKEDGPYGFAPEGPEYDRRVMEVCVSAAFDRLFDFDEGFCDRAAECGHRSFVIMAGALDGLKVSAKALSHQDVTGVGYGICTFHPVGTDDGRHFLEKRKQKLIAEQEKSDGYVKLARASLTRYITAGRKLRLDDPEEGELKKSLPEEMFTKKAGAFVSIHKNGRLRGCIGTIGPVMDNVAQEIVENAISASTRDPRFSPVREEELPFLEIHVDVLGEPEQITSREKLDVKRYGVIVTCGSRRGLLLPDLDGVEDVETQVSIAMQKGGIRPSEHYSLQRFEVIRHT